MAAEVRLNVGLNDTKAKEGLKAIADAIKPLQKVKIDVDTKDALTGLKDLNTIASNLEKKLANVKVGNKVLGTGHNAIDEAIRHAETASRNFAAALREQMEAEQAAAEAHRGMVSSMNGVDQMIQQNEAAARAFSAALKQQMLAEQEEEKEAKKAAQANKDLGKSSQEAGQAASESAGGWTTLGGAIASALGNLASRALHAALMKVRQAIHDALEEMKEVDTQLTNISKVSGKTGKDLADIGNNAYETATKYGESASTYLEAVYAMQKAGMGDQSEAMGELAIKTMLVGDTTQDVATKFLLATNAAWKFEGNMTRLGQIVDEADYINNNYATSLDKLAAGMPIVASVAENAGMSAEETMAALGTITAATQESGTKAATALRALIMNISKETGKFVTEEGEEFEVTEESVKSMQGLLEKYAKTEMDAAKAAGELVNPMTAIRALFQGMAEDDLTDVELFNLLSGMGGKLRTNQLTALVKNFDTLYTDMYEKLPGAAGTADKEIGLMMNSWERKTQVLSDTWTKFIADIVDTDTIKGGVDMLTELVSNLDELVGKAKNPFFDSEQTKDDAENIQKRIDDITRSLEELRKSDSPDQAAIHNLEVELDLQKKILDLKQKQYQLEHEEEAKKLQAQLTQTLYDAMGRPLEGPVQTRDQQAVWEMHNQLNQVDFTGDLTEYQQALQGVVKTYQEYYDNVIKVRDAGETLTENQTAFVNTFESVRDIASESDLNIGNLVDGYYEIVDAEGNVLAHAKDISEEAAKTGELLDRGITPEMQAFTDQTNYLGELLQPISDFFKSAIGTGISDAVKGAGELETAESKATDEAEATGDAVGDIDFSSPISGAGRLTAQLQAAQGAAAAISIGLGPGFATGTKNAPGGPTLVNELGPELISENGHAYIANGGRPGVVNLSRGAIVLTASETRDAIKGKTGNSRKINAAAGETLTTGGGSGPGRAAADRAAREAAILAALAKNTRNPNQTQTDTSGDVATGDFYSATTSGSKGKKGKGGGAAAPAGKSAEELLKEAAQNTKDTLSNIEKQAKLADNRGQYSKEEKLWAKGQAEIDKMIAQYKKAGYKETDDEILDLLNKRYDYEKKKDAASKKTIENAAKDLKEKLSNLDKQAKLANSEGNYVDEVKAYERAQEEIAKMVETYRKAGYADDSDEILELLQKNVDYGEKQVKVYKGVVKDLTNALKSDTDAQDAANKLAEKEQALAEARDALANANKQRTVRTFNAATGQWEWVADQAKVKSAQDTLTKAEKDYSEEVKDQAFKELEKLGDTVTDLNNVVLGPALSAMLLKAESSDEFQNFARALNAVYGVGSFLSSTEGSSKVLNTSDSHDTFYTFGNVTLTEEEASSMSVAELAKRLQVLKIS